MKYFVTQFENVALLIQPKWLLFGIVLQARYDSEIISINICLDIGEELKMTEVEVKVCLWYLHYCLGTIIYYPDLPDKWFEENVICSPQVVFNSIEKLILEPLCSGRLLFKKDRNNWASKGQFSISSLLKCCKVEFPEVEEELKNNRLIPIEQLVELLRYINHLSPILSGEEVTCFMPAILKRATKKELSTPPLPDENNPDPLFITFECGFVPTGVFCGLITRLVSIGTNKIFGMEWNLKEHGVKQNHISFFVHNVNEVTFLSHDKY